MMRVGKLGRICVGNVTAGFAVRSSPSPLRRSLSRCSACHSSADDGPAEARSSGISDAVGTVSVTL